MKRKTVVMANDGFVSETMGYRSALRYAQLLHELGNYRVLVVKLP